MGDRPRAALIGAGRIAPSHVAALRAAGFQVLDVAASKSSQRARKLADALEIPTCWDEPAELAAAAEEWDLLVLAVPSGATSVLLPIAAASGKPVLVEKPVSHDADLLRRWDELFPNVRVGFNRRFFSSVQRVKTQMASEVYLLQVEVCEQIALERPMRDLRERVLNNSIHVVDLMFFLIGALRLSGVTVLGAEDKTATIAWGVSNQGHHYMMVLHRNLPANYSLRLDCSGNRMEICPLEIARAFDTLEVTELPDQDHRIYVPRLAWEESEMSRSSLGKPGFTAQASEMLRLVRGEEIETAARLGDAAQSIEFCDALLAGG